MEYHICHIDWEFLKTVSDHLIADQLCAKYQLYASLLWLLDESNPKLGSYRI